MWIFTYFGDVVLKVLSECIHVLAIVFSESCEYDLPVPYLKASQTQSRVKLSRRLLLHGILYKDHGS